jgi:O-antigen ligase
LTLKSGNPACLGLAGGLFLSEQGG